MVYNNVKIQRLHLTKKQSPKMREALRVSSEKIICMFNPNPKTALFALNHASFSTIKLNFRQSHPYKLHRPL